MSTLVLKIAFDMLSDLFASKMFVKPLKIFTDFKYWFKRWNIIEKQFGEHDCDRYPIKRKRSERQSRQVMHQFHPILIYGNFCPFSILLLYLYIKSIYYIIEKKAPRKQTKNKTKKVIKSETQKYKHTQKGRRE